MSTKKMLLEKLYNAPDAMLMKALDFVRVLKAGRFAAFSISPSSPANEAVDVIFDRPRTLRYLANEQQMFLASLPIALTDIDLPCEE